MTVSARVLVTGARGFIGQRLVSALVSLGVDVVCLDRSAGNSDALGGLKVQRVTADVRDPGAVHRAMLDVGNVDIVFHLAASTAPQSLVAAQATNVQGTANLAASVARLTTPPVLIYVSSLAVAGPLTVAATEAMDCHPVSLYGQTKLEAETQLGQLADRLPITIVRPPCVFGPGDRNLLSLFRSVRHGWNLYADRTFKYSFLFVDDLVATMLAAAERGQRLLPTPDAQRTGVYYVADPQVLTFPELGNLIAMCLGRQSVRHVRIPRLVGWTAATCGQAVQWTLRRRVFFNRDKAREAYGGSWMCDPARAQRQLQVLPYANLEERLAETYTSYQRTGWMPAR